MVFIVPSYYKHAILLPTIYLSNIHSCEYCDHKASTNVQSVHDGVKHSCEYSDSYKQLLSICRVKEELDALFISLYKVEESNAHK